MDILVNDFRAFLSLGRCKSLTSLKLFNRYASQQSRACILFFSTLNSPQGGCSGWWLNGGQHSLFTGMESKIFVHNTVFFISPIENNDCLLPISSYPSCNVEPFGGTFPWFSLQSSNVLSLSLFSPFQPSGIFDAWYSIIKLFRQNLSFWYQIRTGILVTRKLCIDISISLFIHVTVTWTHLNIVPLKTILHSSHLFSRGVQLYSPWLRE